MRKFACKLTSLTPARVEGRVWAALLGKDPLNPANPLNPLNPLSVPECVFWGGAPAFFAGFVEHDTPVQCFVDLFLDLPAKTHTLRAFLEDCLPEILSKAGVLAGGP